MLLTITTTRKPATDLGYLLHKHPDKTQTFDTGAGKAHVFYTEATDERCTAALLLDIDPIGLVRGPNPVLYDYVNDRPYVSSSFLSVAMSRTYASALAGRCRDRPELAETPIPLEARVAAVPCRGQDELLQRLFRPLGYETEVEDGAGGSGKGRYWNVTLRATKTLADMLAHIYVLMPVADNRKHYYIGDAEVDKLMKRGRGWLDDHPERNLIVRRYLGHRRTLAAEAANQLDAEAGRDAEPENAEDPAGTRRKERPTLHDERLDWAVETLARLGPASVVDLGCGEGRLLRRLAERPEFTELAGADASAWSLEMAKHRLRKVRKKKAGPHREVELIQTALTFRDERLEGYEAATLIEVIEHIEPHRLDTLEEVVLGRIRPAILLVTTPNREYNVLYPGLEGGGLRHRDHRFEWTRAEFRRWAERAAERRGYTVTIGGVGEADDTRGQPTQTGVFERCG